MSIPVFTRAHTFALRASPRKTPAAPSLEAPRCPRCAARSRPFTRKFSTEAENSALPFGREISNRLETGSASREDEELSDLNSTLQAFEDVATSSSLSGKKKTLSREEEKAARRETQRKLRWNYIWRKSGAGGKGSLAPDAKATPKSSVAYARLWRWTNDYHLVVDKAKGSNPEWRHAGQPFYQLNTVQEMKEAWNGLDPSAREEMWPSVMLSTLLTAPDKAHMILRATLDPLPPGYAIADVVLFIVKQFSQLAEGFRSPTRRLIAVDEAFKLVIEVLEDLPHNHVRLQQRTLGLAARSLHHTHVKRLLDIARKSNPELHQNTLLHFAAALARSASTKPQAFEILEELIAKGVDKLDPKFLSVVTSLLRQPQDDELTASSGTAQFPQTILEKLMEKDVQPNIINLTALLQNLCNEGSFDEALQLAELFPEAGVQLDKRAAASLIKGAKNTRDVGNLAKAFKAAQESSMPYVDLLTTMLHGVFAFAEGDWRGIRRRRKKPVCVPAFLPLLQLYAQRFNLEPLQKWLPQELHSFLASDAEAIARVGANAGGEWTFQSTILPAVVDFFHPETPMALDPNPETVAVMLRGYVRSLPHQTDLIVFYKHFKKLLRESPKDSMVANLLKSQGSLIHDTVIITMMERQDMCQQALGVFADMMHDYLKDLTVREEVQATDQVPAEAAEQAAGQDGQLATDVAGEEAAEPVKEEAEAMTERTPAVGVAHPRPTIFTFAILIRGLFAHNKLDIIEQILEVMREHGIEHNLASLNTMIKGYASVNKITETVAYLQQVETQGLRPDHFTFRAFGMLKNQEAALRKMEGIITQHARQLGAVDAMELASRSRGQDKQGGAWSDSV